MIVSVSRRTDIPAFYADWFFDRLAEGSALSINPMNPTQQKTIDLRPSSVDGFVFFTKNPAPMLERLPLLDSYPYYFQCTATGYGQDIEPLVPDKDAQVLPTLVQLSKAIGAERVIWRYDPVLLSDQYTVDYHAIRFAEMAQRLSGYVQRCVFSFLDVYPAIAKQLAVRGLRRPNMGEMVLLCESFQKSAAQAGMMLMACAEEMDMSPYGIGRARCVDAALMEQISGRKLSRAKDPGQRPACGCSRSVDIGHYGTCQGGCVYCYAMRGRKAVPMV